MVLLNISPLQYAAFKNFYFSQQREHLRQEQAFGSAVHPEPCKTTGHSLYSHLHCAGEWHQPCSRELLANKNNCSWPRTLLQGIFLELYSTFLQVPCFLVQTYHGLKIPHIFYAVFPLGSHNGAVLLLSSASVLERRGGKKKGCSTK